MSKEKNLPFTVLDTSIVTILITKQQDILLDLLWEDCL